jgi:hypothetical protein
MRHLLLISAIAFILIISGCVSTDEVSPGESLSREIEYVDWVPAQSNPNIPDSGEQPGWTKINESCELINSKSDSKACLESYRKTFMVSWQLDSDRIIKKKIIVKHEWNPDDPPDGPILEKEPTIDPYKIEVYGTNSLAVDWQGNIYYYQTWA